MATHTSIVAGVFTQEVQAKRALDALRQAGFDYDQVGIARQGQGSVDLKNDLLNLGVARASANYYAQEFKAGRTIVSVRPDGREQEAHDLLHQYGGYDYEHRTVSAPPQAQTSVQASADTVQDEFYQPRSLKLHAERLTASKESVQTGEVTLHKDVVTEQKTIDVPVTHEEVVIERHPVTDGQVDATPISEGETIRIPVSEEQVNVTKQTVETGEVAIGKRTLQDTQHVSETVKREEARIEREGEITVQDHEKENPLD
jgi:uncharacterized protein (TIGR02271 family)